MEQEFILLPIFVMGSHFKLNLIGKPGKQDGMDDKYYQALRYVGVAGKPAEQLFIEHYSVAAEGFLS